MAIRFKPYSYIERYGVRLQRLTLDGDFTCPNRDGTLGTGGCTFCDNAAFHPSYTKGKSLVEQIDAGSVPPSFTDAPWGLLRHDELMRRLIRRLEEMALQESSY